MSKKFWLEYHCIYYEDLYVLILSVFTLSDRFVGANIWYIIISIIPIQWWWFFACLLLAGAHWNVTQTKLFMAQMDGKQVTHKPMAYTIFSDQLQNEFRSGSSIAVDAWSMSRWWRMWLFYDLIQFILHTECIEIKH